MKRDLNQLANHTYDVLVVGGGIYGACVAWDAILRGLSVALVERDDFGYATSANSMKTIHGGLRYLQHLDFKRMRESIRERKTLMQIAPHLVHPLPYLMPLYGHRIKGKEVMALALMVNELISIDRNWQQDSQKCLPRSQIISKRKCLELLPHISQQGLTGGAIWYDGQMYNSERLTLAFVLSAAQSGANVANHIEVTGFLQNKERIVGVKAIDRLTGTCFNIRARMVVNTAGPWVNQVLGLLNKQSLQTNVRFAKAINLITCRPLFQTYAVAISSPQNGQDANSVNNTGNRLLFISPWRNYSMIGTKYMAYDGSPDTLNVTDEEIESFLKEVNQAYPPANLKREEISFVHRGLVPVSNVNHKTGSIQRAKQYHILRHQGLRGLISVVGVKYTTARDVAEKVVNQIFEIWDKKPPAPVSAVTPLYGGQIDQFSTFLQTEVDKQPCGLNQKTVSRLIYNYGSVYPQVLRYFEKCEENQPLSDEFAVLRAEILHGVREELAQKLADIVFRRTELGTAGRPSDEVLSFCAEVMGKELGWNQTKIKQELQEVNNVFAGGIQH